MEKNKKVAVAGDSKKSARAVQLRDTRADRLCDFECDIRELRTEVAAFKEKVDSGKYIQLAH